MGFGLQCTHAERRFRALSAKWWVHDGTPKRAGMAGPSDCVNARCHSIAFTMSSTTFFASPNTIMVLSM